MSNLQCSAGRSNGQNACRIMDQESTCHRKHHRWGFQWQALAWSMIPAEHCKQNTAQTLTHISTASLSMRSLKPLVCMSPLPHPLPRPLTHPPIALNPDHILGGLRHMVNCQPKIRTLSAWLTSLVSLRVSGTPTAYLHVVHVVMYRCHTLSCVGLVMCRCSHA